MTKHFDFEPAAWLPFRDKEPCRKARAIVREDLLNPENPNLEVEIIPDAEFPFRLVMHLFQTIAYLLERLTQSFLQRSLKLLVHSLSHLFKLSRIIILHNLQMLVYSLPNLYETLLIGF